MSQYYKVTAYVGTPHRNSVEVTIPLVGPAGATGATGATGPAGSGIEILTTQGDLLYRGASDGQRLPIGTAGQVLKVSGGIPAWGAESGSVSSVAGRTGAVTLAVADVANAVATSDSRLTDARTPSSTLAHAPTHHTGGTDAIAPNSIGAAWALDTRSHTFFSTSTYTLAQGRNVQLDAGVTPNSVTGIIVLPRLVTDSAQNGDDLFIRVNSVSVGSSIDVRRYISLGGGNYLGTTESILTVTANSENRSLLLRLLDSVWTALPINAHTHAAGAITSGVLDNARVNFAAPAAIGNTTPAAGNFTTIRVDPKNGATGSLVVGSTTGSETNTIVLDSVGLKMQAASGRVATIERPSLLDANRSYQLPDVSGTFVVSGITGITGADAVTNIVSLTQAEYNAIGSPDAATLFLITDP
jgi:hypothetical protein